MPSDSDESYYSYDVLTTGSTAEAAYTALTKVCKDCKISLATLGYVE